MQLGDAVVVAIEKGQEILRQIAPVLWGQAAHDPEVHGYVPGPIRILPVD